MRNLATELEQYLYQCNEFDWARFNCCHYAAGWVKHVEGLDTSEHFPETPSRLAAIRHITASGGWREVITKALSREVSPVSLLQTGDLALVELECDSTCLGIVSGRHAHCLPQEGKPVAVQLSSAKIGWKLQAK